MKNVKEKLTLVDSTAELALPGAALRSLPAQEVIGAIQSEGITGMTEEPLRECVRWRVKCGAWTIYVLELKPGLRWIRWIDPKSPIPFGPDALYSDYKLATPYVVLLIPFKDGRVQSRCEVFYRNEPIENLDSKLFWSNLLNVSPNAYGCIAWFCTQYLAKELKLKSRRSRQVLTFSGQLDAVLTHLWGGGFNRSSEHNEGQSCFSKAVEDRIDARVTDVERWQAESVADSNFVREVEWKSTKLSVRRLIMRHFARAQLPRDLADTGELVNVLLARSNGKEV